MFLFYNVSGANDLRFASWNVSETYWTDRIINPPDNSEDFSGVVGSPTVTIHRDRVHVAGLTSGGDVKCASYCTTSSSCTYNPGYWTNAFAKYDDTQYFVTLFGDGDSYLYRFTGYTNKDVYREYKRSE